MVKLFGYYVFLGAGDYDIPKYTDKNWLLNWREKEWDNFFHTITKLNANTIMIYLNGHYLPYASKKFPKLVDTHHFNVSNEYFSKILLLAKKKYKLNVIGVVSTTGHSGIFAATHPELVIKQREKSINVENLLCSFSHGIRKGKDKPQKGNAQVGKGILCHNNPIVRKFSIQLIQECLAYYNHLDGVAFHPPETIYTCSCAYCSNLFRKQYNDNILLTSNSIARNFFITSYLDFQKNGLEKMILKYFPTVKKYTFTVPWLFEKVTPFLLKHIPSETTIIDWDYNLDPNRIMTLGNRLEEYTQKQHKVIFMPSNYNMDDKMNKNVKIHEQTSIALNKDVAGIIHFVGPNTNNLKFTDFAALSK